MEETYFRKGFGLKAEVKPVIDAEYHSGLVERIRSRGYTDTFGDVTVRLAEEFGFCYGVDRAVDYAYETVHKFPDRRIFLVGEINHVSASRAIMQMLYLHSIKKDRDINLYINAPGGVVDDTLAIYDIMRFLTCDIATYCIGGAESGGAIVFMAGKKGKRFILPNAKVMIHQPFGGVYGQAADIEIQAEEILKTKETLINIMARCTGQTPDRVREDSERDRFFDAKAAVAYGLCDEVLGEDADPEVAAAAADGTKPK